MQEDKDHSRVAALTLSGTDINVGTYDSSRSPEGSVYFQTEDNPEPVYIRIAEAKLLVAALAAAIDFLEKGD